nr:P0 [Barley yellow dwarf virus]
MFVATPAGRVLVQFEEHISVDCVLRSILGLTSLFVRAYQDYSYGPNEICLFSVSLAYMLPVLFTGKSHVWRNGLSLPIRFHAHLLRWGLAIGYTPVISTWKRTVHIDLCTMSSAASYRSQLQRLESSSFAAFLARHPHALLYGPQHFFKLLAVYLRCVEQRSPKLLWTSPVVSCLFVDRNPSTSFLDCVFGRNRLLLTGRFIDVTRYYNELDLQGVEVDFWYAAGISLHKTGADYLAGSYLQKILQ